MCLSTAGKTVMTGAKEDVRNKPYEGKRLIVSADNMDFDFKRIFEVLKYAHIEVTDIEISDYYCS